MEQAIEHCAQGAGIWEWPGPTTAAAIRTSCWPARVTWSPWRPSRGADPQGAAARVQGAVVNVVDLMTLPRPKDHPHGMSGTLFTELFTDTVDVIFAFHGYRARSPVGARPAGRDRFRVRGFIEEGTTTTPFDMMVRKQASRYHLVMDAINNAKRCPAAHPAQGLVRGSAGQARGILCGAPGGHAEVRDWTLGG